MKLTVAVVGRLKEPYLVAAEQEYTKRLRPYCTLTVHEARDEAALLAAIPTAPTSTPSTSAAIHSPARPSRTTSSAPSNSTAAAPRSSSRSAAPTATRAPC